MSPFATSDVGTVFGLLGSTKQKKTMRGGLNWFEWSKVPMSEVVSARNHRQLITINSDIRHGPHM